MTDFLISFRKSISGALKGLIGNPVKIGSGPAAVIPTFVQAISKMQITFKDKARADEKAQHTCEYVSILKRLATQ